MRSRARRGRPRAPSPGDLRRAGGGWCGRARRGTGGQCCGVRRGACRASCGGWGKSAGAWGAESAARGGGTGEGAGPADFPAGSPEEALRGLGPFPPALWDKVQAAPEAEFARTERWYGLGHDVAEINRLAAPLLADIGAAVRRPDLHARPAFVHHVMGLACDLAQVNVCADLLGLAEEVQTHCAAARLWGKAARGDPGALAEALGRAVREPVRGLQGALQPLGDFFGAVVAEVFPAVSLLYRLEELQATGALDIDGGPPVRLRRSVGYLPPPRGGLPHRRHVGGPEVRQRVGRPGARPAVRRCSPAGRLRGPPGLLAVGGARRRA